jgi:hypothetical protein
MSIGSTREAHGPAVTADSSIRRFAARRAKPDRLGRRFARQEIALVLGIERLEAVNAVPLIARGVVLRHADGRLDAAHRNARAARVQFAYRRPRRRRKPDSRLTDPARLKMLHELACLGNRLVIHVAVGGECQD